LEKEGNEVKIVVLVKQVPATDKVKMDEETGTMIRDGVEAEPNPLDLYAVEEAVRIKKRLNDDAEISVLSMGPRKAVDAIKHAIAMGCDTGYLLSDRKFAGSDVWSTAYTLATAIRKVMEDFDLIICGERATDGETGQVGPEVGAYLEVPVLTYVSKVEKIGGGKIVAHRAIEGGHEVVEAPIPALISVVKEINEPEMPTLRGKMKAKKTDVPILSFGDIDADEQRLGLNGSATRVVKVFRPQLARGGEMVSAAEDLEGSVNRLMDFLTEKGIV
jgi:electron transfer flavoprotein beta subunit